MNMVKKLLNFIAFIMLTFASAVWGFSSTDQINNNPSTNTSSTTKTTTEKSLISPMLNDLPADYSDVNGIKKYSTEQPVNNEAALMQQQLDDLKNAYLRLKLDMSQRGPEKPAEDPRDQQAKSSGFSFAGLESGVDKLVGPGAGDKLQRPELPSDDKMKIKNTDKATEVYDSHAMLKPASPYQLIAGTIIPASLVTAINSTVPGTVVAHITRNIYDTVTGKYLLVPRGSKAIGEYTSRGIAPGQSRVALEFNRIVRPDGSSIQLGRFAATDVQGSAGLEGDVDNHWGQVIGASVLGALISYGAGSMSDRIGNNKNNKNKEYSGAQQNSINNAGNSINNVAANITNRALNMPPTIKLPAGYQFNITVKKDMILTPYSDY